MEENFTEITSEEVYSLDGDFIISILKAAKFNDLQLDWTCPICGEEEIDADSVCRAYTPSAAISGDPDTGAVCGECLKSVCFHGEEGWFDDEFNKIALADVIRVKDKDGTEFWKIDDGEELVKRDREEVVWKGSVYDLVWSGDSFCKSHRASHGIDDEKMAKDSEIAHDFILEIGKEIR